MLGVDAPAPNLIFVLLIPIAGLMCCVAIGTLIFSTWTRLRRR
ncbi:MAG: hypothetical protein WCB85_07065 [Candidatus Dormiibacterota bacterium]